MAKIKIIGPFTQLLTMDKIPLKGSVNDSQLEVIPNGGLVVQEGKIIKTGNFGQLCSEIRNPDVEIDRIEKQMVAMPGMIDPHTHICWAGS
ncbi:MAG TPA: hypothetical protein VGK38_15740 [Prolixibacteraceae bacterium]